MNVITDAITAKVTATTEVETFGESGDSFGFDDSMGFSVQANNDFFNSIGGRFYYQEAPQETTYPYCVYFLINTEYEFTFLTDFERALVLFNLYGDTNSSEETGEIQEYLKTLFDWCSLTISGYTHLKMERNFSDTSRFDADKVWQCVVQYTLLIQKEGVRT